MLNTRRFVGLLVFTFLGMGMQTASYASPLMRNEERAGIIAPANSVDPDATDTTRNDDTTKHVGSYRIALGAGSAWGTNAASNLTVGIVATYLYKFHVFSVRYILNTSAEQSKLPSESEQNFAILYGVGHRYSFVFLNAGVGIGYSAMKLRGNFLYSQPDGDYYESVYSHAFGIALQAQVMFPVYKTVDVGITAFGNLSPVATPTGVLLSVQIGDF
jgi:hypothetical protein